MANDSTNKTNSSGNNSENKSLSTIDQQKVPPLRIVLNTAGNQRSSSAAVTFNTNNTSNNNNTNQHRKDKTQDVKPDVGTLKSGNKVRIKLGSNRQQTGRGGGSNSDQANKIGSDGAQKVKNINTDPETKQDDTKEDSSLINQNHLRRITRRSQRAVQSVSNEDEESISSMTSIDENSNTNNTNNSDNNTAPDTEQSSTVTTTTNTITSTTSAANGSTNVETPRRYKRRKGEVSESLSIDSDSLFGSQNYKLPNQNSFELYKNIRKQVDKKLNSLTNIHPKTPYGFRDYMLTKGAYLLDGNKLGNGTNLFIGEDGGLHSTQLGKYHALKKNKVNYSIPNQAKVPLGLPVNSPLYDLFIEQERERYRMRMQHIKEREKLTLAAEQEIMRVYNQAALSAADQTEPFSVCTMLKHQEIYNYLDSEGYTIMSQEDSQREQSKPDRVRTRRRPQDQVSPQPTSKGSSEDSNQVESNSRKEQKPATTSEPQKEDEGKSATERPTESTSGEKSTEAGESPMDCTEETKTSSSNSEPESVSKDTTKQDAKSAAESPPESDPTNVKEPTATKTEKSKTTAENLSKPDESNGVELNQIAEQSTTAEIVEEQSSVKVKSESNDCVKDQQPESNQMQTQEIAPTNNKIVGQKLDENKTQETNDDDTTYERALDDMSKNSEEQSQVSSIQQQADNENESQSLSESSQSLSDEAKRSQNRELFLSQLQEIDDKWERIRLDMLIRHRNEAESLYAIQKLEWEWKIKEIGACDIRTTPVIDSTLVPKLNIYYQDY